MDVFGASKFVADETAKAARRTRATFRGNVDSIREDGTPVVKLPNGAKILAADSNLFGVTPQQSITLIRSGQGFESLAPSSYGGGLGAPTV